MFLPDRSALFTLLTVGMVAVGTVGANRPEPLAALQRHLPITDTLSVYLREQYAGTLVASLSAHDRQIINRIVLSVEMNVPGGVQRIGLEEERIFAENGNLLEARQTMASPAGKNSWELCRDRAGFWQLSVTTAGVVNRRAVSPANEHIRSLAALYNGIFSGTLKKGTTWTDTATELTSGEPVITITRCVGTPREGSGDSCWSFISTSSIIDREERWTIDRRGATIYRDMYPYTARRKRPGIRPGKQARTGTDAMFEMMKISVPGPLRTGSEALLLLFDTRRSIDSSVAGWYTPYKNGYLLKPLRKQCTTAVDPALTDAEKAALCAPTSTLQSAHPLLRQLADSLGKGIGDDDPCNMVKIFNHAVYTRLTRKNSATFSSALETLEAGYGDCGEHAVLLAALLRAAGIAARVVLGLLYVPSKKGYYYHAWVMAYTGSWIFADPSHDCFPAFQHRVPLLIDDNGSRMVVLGTIIGRLSIDHIPAPQR